jgi:hypothetical protein
VHPRDIYSDACGIATPAPTDASSNSGTDLYRGLGGVGIRRPAPPLDREPRSRPRLDAVRHRPWSMWDAPRQDHHDRRLSQGPRKQHGGAWRSVPRRSTRGTTAVLAAVALPPRGPTGMLLTALGPRVRGHPPRTAPGALPEWFVRQLVSPTPRPSRANRRSSLEPQLPPKLTTAVTNR